jgi:hypothetical protein
MPSAGQALQIAPKSLKNPEPQVTEPAPTTISDVTAMAFLLALLALICPWPSVELDHAAYSPNFEFSVTFTPPPLFSFRAVASANAQWYYGPGCTPTACGGSAVATTFWNGSAYVALASPVACFCASMLTRLYRTFCCAGIAEYFCLFNFLELFAVRLFPRRPTRRRLLLPESRRARLLQRCCECLSRCVVSSEFVYHALIGMPLTSRQLYLVPQCHKSPKSLPTPARPAARQSPSAALNSVRRPEPPMLQLLFRTLANRYRSLVILSSADLIRSWLAGSWWLARRA